MLPQKSALSSGKSCPSNKIKILFFLILLFLCFWVRLLRVLLKRAELAQRRRPVLEVNSDQALLAHVADNIAAVVDEELNAVLLHQPRLVLAVAAEEPALLRKPRLDARSPQALARQILRLLAAERQQIDYVGLC